ncbi:MAG: type I-U CRISPR-associated protein Cas8c [Gemmataceae bacterium]
MSDPITVSVDPTNPGQFFACCGLLELADRLWPGAEGRFSADGREFKIACGGHSLTELLAELGKAKFESSLGSEGLKRLGSLKSKDKTKRTAQDWVDLERLDAMWKVERIHLSAPFDLWLDWWWNDNSGVKALKTWAAKQLVLDIARPMLEVIGKMTWTDESPSPCLKAVAKWPGLPFYFDAANNTQNTPRDNGFAPGTVKSAPNDRPLVELLTFIGLQRFRPDRPENSDLIRYTLWPVPLPPNVAGAAASGKLMIPGSRTFEFRMLYRTEYMKAVLPALPTNGA